MTAGENWINCFFEWVSLILGICMFAFAHPFVGSALVGCCAINCTIRTMKAKY